MPGRFSVQAISLVALWLAVCNPAALGQVTVTDLGALPGSSFCIANAVNNIPEIAGMCATPSGDRAFYWSVDTGMVDLGSIPGRNDSVATGINDDGQIVGYASDGSGAEPIAFRWSNSSGMQGLGALPSRPASRAFAINNAGQIVGTAFDPNENLPVAFLWSAGSGMQPITTFGGPSSEARGLNEAGQIVGAAEAPFGQGATSQAFLWSPGAGARALGTLGGPNTGSAALGMNNIGMAVGWSASPPTGTAPFVLPFLWSPQLGMRNLGTLPLAAGAFAFDVNDVGVAVGWSVCNGSCAPRAVRWAAGAITDLSSLPGVAASGWSLLQATAINNAGQIVGYGEHDGRGSAFLLSSIPLPAPEAIKSAGACPPAGQGPGDDPERPDRCDPGNPINPFTGNKYQIDIDYAGTGIHPLIFGRYYNSGVESAANMGNQWRHTFARSVESSGSFAKVFRPDAKHYVFRQDGEKWVADADVSDRLFQVADGWIYITSPFSEVERYDVNGRLISLADRAGVGHLVGYDGNGRISSVRHSATNAALTFTYDASNRISELTDPAGKIYRYAYQAGNLATVTYPDDTAASSDDPVRTYLYNESQHTSNANLPGHLTGVIDENNSRFATYRYDPQGRGISTEHAGGAGKYIVSYHSNGTSAITDPLLTTRTYAFQIVHGVPRDTSVSLPCDGCGVAKQTVYDGNGFLSNTTNFNNVTTTYLHDARGLEAVRSLAAGTPQSRTISTQWHPTFRIPVAIAEPKRLTTLNYDDRGNLTARTVQATTDPNGASGFSAAPTGAARTWTYTNTYSANAPGVMVQQVADGPRTDVADLTVYRWNDAGNLISVTNALGHVTTFADYDVHGRPGRVTDSNGLVTAFTYDARGRLTSRTTGSEVTRFSYDAVGQPTKLTLPDASFLSYAYDAAHRLTQIADSLGNKIVYTLDAMGNRTKTEVFDPSGVLARKRSREYNALNRLIKDIGGANPAMEITQYGYDNQGNLTNLTDPLNRTTSNGYDALNRLVSVIQPAPNAAGPGASTQYGYDGLDQLTQVTDPKGLTTAYTIDGLGNLAQQFSPDTGITSRTYDAAGNVKTSTDARGQTTRYTYDALNRVTLVDYASGTDTVFEYDGSPNAKGRLTRMSDASGTTTWFYDPIGRVTRKAQTVQTVTRAVDFAYEVTTGKLTSITYPSPNYGRVVGFTYAADGRISSISVNGIIYLSNIAYAPFGPPKSWQWGRVRSYTRSYDLNGRLKTYPAQLATRTLSYDAAGRITAITDNTTPSLNSTFGYDNLDRLTSYTGFPGDRAYTYDANGNRTSATLGGKTYPYVVDPNSNRLLSAGGEPLKTFTYDAAGNITSDGLTTFNYDSRGRLASTRRAYTTSYLINGLGQRVKKQGASLGGPAGEGNYYFLYDEDGRLLGVYGNNGAPFHEYVYLEGMLVLDLMATGSPTIPTVPYHVITDQTGTPRMMIGSSNEIVWRWDSAPFGDSMPIPGGNSPIWSHLRFPGQFFDPQTGLNYNYFRDYDPGTGRYIEPDPIGLPSVLNPYAYAFGNPVSYTDLFGLEPDGHHWVIGEIRNHPELSPAARRVFQQEAKTGWYGERHDFSGGHPKYNEGVKELWERYKAENKIVLSNLTREQAEAFVTKIKLSPDVRIAAYRKEIIRKCLRWGWRQIPAYTRKE
jgi:RHS repeat-associated protein